MGKSGNSNNTDWDVYATASNVYDSTKRIVNVDFDAIDGVIKPAFNDAKTALDTLISALQAINVNGLAGVTFPKKGYLVELATALKDGVDKNKKSLETWVSQLKNADWENNNLLTWMFDYDTAWGESAEFRNT